MEERASALIYYSCATGISKAAAALHNPKITDNSFEARPCLFSSPRASSALVYQLMYTSPAESPLMRLRSLSQVQHTERYVWVGGHVHGYVCAAWFSYNFKSSFGCA